MAKRSNGMRNLQSAGNSAAKFTGRTTEKAAVGLFRWAVTDHSNMGRALANMPSTGFIDSLRYILWQFLYAVPTYATDPQWLCQDTVRHVVDSLVTQ